MQEGVPNPLRYMGREWDPDAGLYYVRNRWYDPLVGRFISEDPIGIAGGINVYAYVGNDPVNLTDPFGLCVGETYNVDTTVCRLDPIVVTAKKRGGGKGPERTRTRRTAGRPGREAAGRMVHQQALGLGKRMTSERPRSAARASVQVSELYSLLRKMG